MNKVVTERKNKLFPWGIEIELFNGRCIYLGAKSVIAYEDCIELVINDMNTISIPKTSIKKMLVIGAETNAAPED